jgi:putative salt-induced outer membrane protein YdiY
VFGGLGYTADRYAVARIVDDELRDRYSHPTALFGEESTHAFSASTSAKQRLVVTADLQNSGEYRAQWDMGLDVAMSNALSLTVGLSVRHDSDPGFGLKSTDTLFTTGVALKFD